MHISQIKDDKSSIIIKSNFPTNEFEKKNKFNGIENSNKKDFKSKNINIYKNVCNIIKSNLFWFVKIRTKKV